MGDDMKKYVAIFGLLIIILVIGIIYYLSNYNIQNENSENKSITNDNQIVQNSKEDNEEKMQKIKITVNNKEFIASIQNSQTSEEFLNMLPLNIKMNELNGNEKYYYFDNTISINQIKPNKIECGDIMLYGNNCLVLFYKSHDSSYSYTRIGKIDDTTGLEEALGKSNVDVLIEKI